MKINSIKRNFFWNALGSIFNSSTSLFFLIIVTRINGIDNAGIFSFAFSTACVLQVIGLYAGRAYQVTEQNKNISNNDYVYNRIISCFIMILFALGFVFIRKYDFSKSILIIFLILFKSIEAFSEVIYGIIQKNNDLYKVGISLLIKGILSLLVFIFIDLITNNILISSIGLILTNIVILVLYDIKNIKIYNYKWEKINFKNILYIFKFGFWTFLFTFLTQYVINSPKYAIDNYLSNDLQTIYGIIAMPATLIILCSQFLIHPFLVSLCENLKDNNIKAFNKLVFKLICYLILFGIMANIASYFIGIPFLEMVYGIELDKYLICLLYIITGATIFGISYIFCNALTTMRKTLCQSIIFIIDSIFAFFISNYLVKSLNITGASISYLLTMVVLLILYLIIYIYEISKFKRRCKSV